MNTICQLIVILALTVGARGLEARTAAVAPCPTPQATNAATAEECCEPCSPICRWLCELFGCKPEPCCPPKGCCS